MSHIPRRVRSAFLLGVLACGAGCSPHLNIVRAQAASDLQCPESALDVHDLVGRTEVGVSGCGHRAVYKRTGEGWVLTNANAAE
jgi:hypothetical protein